MDVAALILSVIVIVLVTFVIVGDYRSNNGPPGAPCVE
jgi:hypothetical protein